MSTVSADSTIQKVVVYRDRAQVFRTATVPLAPGDHTITFAMASALRVDRDTLQVATTPVAGTSIVLRGVQFQTLHEVEDVREERRALDARIADVERQITSANDDITVATQKLTRIGMVRTRLTTGMKDGKKGAALVYDTQKWREMSEFLSAGEAAAMAERRAAQRVQSELEDTRNDVRAQLRRLGHGNQRTTTREVAEVTLSVVPSVAPGAGTRSSAPRDVEMLISYVCRNCSWAASYDLRIDKASRSMQVTYSANVSQHTGESWNDVRLELSTAQAHVGGSIPKFAEPWYLREKQPELHLSLQGYGGQQQQGQQFNMMQQMMAPQQQQMMTNVMPPGAGGGAFGGAPPPPPRPAFASAATQAAQVSSNSTSATFTIAALTTVKDNNEPVKVTIAVLDLAIFLRYSATPKVQAGQVFLKVKATNTSHFPLLSGPANVFADEQLISKTVLDDVAPAEEWWCFLGEDSAVSCERKTLSLKTVDTAGSMFRTAKTKKEFFYEFTAKNTKSTAEELVVWDSIPIPADARIVVEQLKPVPDHEGRPPRSEADPPLFKISSVKYIEFFVPLAPGQEKKFEFSFTVEYPTELRIEGL